jgi:hypothetical protein
MSALTMGTSEKATGDPGEELDAIASLVQNGAFNAKEPLGETLARTAAMFRADVADDLRTRTDYCDLDEWAQSSTQLRSDSSSRWAWQRSPPPGRTSRDARNWNRLPRRGRGGRGESHRRDADAVRDFLSADRDWYATQFPYLESRFGIEPDAAAAGWNRVPFETRPFLRLEDGRLMLWSPRTMIGWLTDGFYFRALDTATQRGKEPSFRTYFGALVEDYVCTVLEETSRSRDHRRRARSP